jgi:hypothetical protein
MPGGGAREPLALARLVIVKLMPKLRLRWVLPDAGMWAPHARLSLYIDRCIRSS